MLALWPKNGGNIQVATSASESRPGATPEKMHSRSLSIACWMREGVNDACYASERLRNPFMRKCDTLAESEGLFSCTAFSTIENERTGRKKK